MDPASTASSDLFFNDYAINDNFAGFSPSQLLSFPDSNKKRRSEQEVPSSASKRSRRRLRVRHIFYLQFRN